MARTHVENYSSASRKYTNAVIKKNGTKRSDDSSSTHSSMSSSDSGNGRRKVATSMRKFLEDDGGFDYLGSLTQGNNSKTYSKDTSKHSNFSRKRNPTSYRKNSSSDYRRPGVPRSSSKNKPVSIRRQSDVYEGSLNDAKPSESGRSLMSSARKLVDKAVRAASPGKLRRDRSKSPGPQKTRNSIRAARSKSPISSRPYLLNTSPNSRSPSSSSRKKRSKSPGRLKKGISEESGENEEETPKSSKMRNRSKSPGRMKSRSKSPGKMKNRSQSPGALRKDRPRRRPENGDDNNTSTRRRSRSNGPMKKPTRARSTDRNKSRSRFDGAPSKSSRSTRSNDSEGVAPLKKESGYSDMQDGLSRHELSRHKVKRNKSMDTAMAMQAMRAPHEIEDDESKFPPRRAESMMLSREKGRRGKSNSLADLVQYKEEQIHSTSYFASNHVLVNRERMKRGLRPLTRNIAMDDLARKSADAMASSNGLNALPTTYVGNVLRGETIRTIHRSTMLQKQGRERSNILNPYFQDFGVGTCKGSDGQLYMCQLFSERLELALTDTADMDGPSDD